MSPEDAAKVKAALVKEYNELLDGENDNEYRAAYHRALSKVEAAFTIQELVDAMVSEAWDLMTSYDFLMRVFCPSWEYEDLEYMISRGWTS